MKKYDLYFSFYLEEYNWLQLKFPLIKASERIRTAFMYQGIEQQAEITQTSLLFRLGFKSPENPIFVIFISL